MHKKFLLFLIFFLPVQTITAQSGKASVLNNSFIINFVNTNQDFIDQKKGKFTVRDYYEFTDPSKQGEFKLPTKNYLIALPPLSKPQVKIVSKKEDAVNLIVPRVNPELIKANDSTLSLKKVELNNVKSANNSVIQIKGYVWFRDFYCAVIELNTHIYNAQNSTLTIYNSLQIQFSFSQKISIKNQSPIQEKSKFDKTLKNVIYNWGIAEQFRSKRHLLSNDSTDSWINFNNKYLKLKVGEDGIYRISADDLKNFGIQLSSINPKTFQLFNKGHEMEITVKGESDNTFDNNDFIEFYGSKNHENDYRTINAPSENYNEYLNRYTDTSYYFLTWGIGNGRRIPVQRSSQKASDTLKFYNHFEHIENNTMFQNLNGNEVANQNPDWRKNKSWYWDWIFTSTKNYNFIPTDLYPNKPVNIYFKLVSAGSNVPANSHQLALKLNGVTVDSQSVDRFEQVLLHANVNSSILNNTDDNISIVNYANGTSPNFLALDWYDIEYPRKLNLVNDSLSFEVKDQLSNSEVNLEIGNASTPDLIVYRIANKIKKIENFSFINNTIILFDTLTDGDKFIIIPEEKILKPELVSFNSFVNLKDSSNQADYLAITHPKFLSAVNNYVNSIKNMYNVKTCIVNVEDIYNQFGFGYSTPESIKLFFETVLAKWGTPLPSYTTLIGDANYDFKGYVLKASGVRLGENYVPSYGVPVGDNWYVTFNENIIPIPQLKLGRIPINESGELEMYQDKVENNFNSEYDDWNKKYLFFSGGIESTEYAVIKSANDAVISNIIKPKPISGIYTHFYKTADPTSDFGPYTPQEIRSAISQGGVFISYVGHSGTSTWDNSINSTEQLKNDVNRNPLITDFGCSTNKFAEPDITAFGEKFLLRADGQALTYIGNSSLGFVSTATNAPKLFYSSFLTDSTKEIGNAHLYLKSQLFSNLGSSDVVKIFSLTNTILGDPTIRLKIPKLPDLEINEQSLYLNKTDLTVKSDSVKLKLYINNFGLVTNDSLSVVFEHSLNNKLIESKIIRIQLPEITDTLSLWLMTKLPGEHVLNVKLDFDNEIEEINENNNSILYSFNIFSSQLRDLIVNNVENPWLKDILLLNPSNYSADEFNIIFQLSKNSDFSPYQDFNIPSDSLFTRISLNSLQPDQRYWFRYKINHSNSHFNSGKSFYTIKEAPFLLKDFTSLSSQQLYNLSYDFNSNSITLSNDSVNISVLSAGWYSGANCVIAKNGINLLSNSFFAGMGIVVFDPVTMNVDTSTWYNLFGNPDNVQALADLINSIPQGKIVAMGVADDARNNLSTNLRNAIKSLGSTMIDSLKFRGSWAIIGKKGAMPDETIERVNEPYDGLVSINSNFTIRNRDGYLLTNSIGPSHGWNKILKKDSSPANSDILYKILGEKNNGDFDTLSVVVNDSLINLKGIDFHLYSKIKLLAAFSSNDKGESPSLSELSCYYDVVPELGTNYQVVSVSNDSVDAGAKNNLSFYVYNVGGFPAGSFKVKVQIIKPDNSRNEILNENVISLQSEERKLFKADYENKGMGGNYIFHIEIDPENKISELYKDNNFFDIPFYVKGDTTTLSVSPASFTAKYDGVDIMDGEYISNTPDIEMTLNYPVWFPAQDTNAVAFYLDDKKIPYSEFQINYDNARINKYIFSPELSDGEHSIKVFGINNLGILESTPGYEKSFLVLDEAKILNVYNFPNPFNNDTYFTFKLTQIPDELKIKIYTIAGRLIKEIEKKSSELNFDFNKIFWDGRDEDGDLIANGVYLYKIIMKKGNKTEDITQKLAVVR